MRCTGYTVADPAARRDAGLSVETITQIVARTADARLAASDVQHLDVRNELGIREGGFGIMLAKGLVDEFRYNDKGNEVTLIKRFEKPTPPASPAVTRRAGTPPAGPSSRPPPDRAVAASGR